MCQVGAGQLDVGTGRNNLIHTMLLFLYRWINFSLMISTFCGSGFDRIGLACWEGSTLVSLASIYFGCWTSRLMDQKWQFIFLHSLVLIWLPKLEQGNCEQSQVHMISWRVERNLSVLYHFYTKNKHKFTPLLSFKDEYWKTGKLTCPSFALKTWFVKGS